MKLTRLVFLVMGLLTLGNLAISCSLDDEPLTQFQDDTGDEADDPVEPDEGG